MAGLLGLSPSTVAAPAVAATPTPAPQIPVAQYQQPTYSAPAYQPYQMPQWTSNPAVPTANQQNQQTQTAAQPTVATPATNTIAQSQPDYFAQFFNSLSSIFGNQTQPTQATTPAPVATPPAINPATTGLLAPDAFKRPDWIDSSGQTAQPVWKPEPTQPAAPPVQATPAATTPSGPWANGWDPYAEYDKANAGQLTMKDPVTGRMYNPNAHPYFNAYAGGAYASGATMPTLSPFGNIDARGFVTLNGSKQDPMDAWRQQQDSNRGN